MKKGTKTTRQPEKQPAREYSLQQAVMISRWITKCLDNHPAWFAEEGVFRLSGNKNEVENIVSAILEKQDLTLNPDFRDEYIGALKMVLSNSVLVSKDDPDVKVLRAAFLNQDVSEQEGSLALSHFIVKCASSEDPNKVLLAEILHNYLHILKLAEKQKATNKMNTNNLGIIIAPIIINKILQIPETNNPMAALTLNERMKNISMPLISGNDYIGSFKLDERIEQTKKDYASLLEGREGIKRLLEGYSKQQAGYLLESSQLESKYKAGTIKKSQYEVQKKAIDANFMSATQSMEQQNVLLHALEYQLSDRFTTFQSLIRQRNEWRVLNGLSPTEESLPTEPPKRTSTPIVRQSGERPEYFEGLNEPLQSTSISPMSLTPPSSPPSLSADSTPPDSVSSSPDISPQRRRRTPPLTFAVSAETAAEDFRLALAHAKEGSPKPDKVILNLIKTLKVQNLSSNVIGEMLYDHRELLKEYKVELGNILSENSDESKALLEGYVNQFQFQNTEFGPALKEFLEKGGFRLPGESQKIDRIMQAFGNHFYKSNNPGKPANEVTAGTDKMYLLAFATIMLNTDLHNPQNKRKMEKKEFIRQVKDCGIDDPAYATRLYDFINKNEIRMQEPTAKASTSLKETLFGKKRPS